MSESPTNPTFLKLFELQTVLTWLRIFAFKAIEPTWQMCVRACKMGGSWSSVIQCIHPRFKAQSICRLQMDAGILGLWRLIQNVKATVWPGDSSLQLRTSAVSPDAASLTSR